MLADTEEGFAMLRKKKRSREFKKNSQVVNISEAREERRAKRKALRQTEDFSPTTADERFYESEGSISQRKKVRKKRRRRAYIAVLLCFAVLVSASLINIISLRAERAAVQNRNAELTALKIKLEGQLEDVNNPEYIEGQARTQLRLVKPGEVLYIFPIKDSDTASGEKEKTQDEE